CQWSREGDAGASPARRASQANEKICLTIESLVGPNPLRGQRSERFLLPSSNSFDALGDQWIAGWSPGGMGPPGSGRTNSCRRPAILLTESSAQGGGGR